MQSCKTKFISVAVTSVCWCGNASFHPSSLIFTVIISSFYASQSTFYTVTKYSTRIFCTFSVRLTAFSQNLNISWALGCILFFSSHVVVSCTQFSWLSEMCNKLWMLIYFCMLDTKSMVQSMMMKKILPINVIDILPSPGSTHSK